MENMRLGKRLREKLNEVGYQCGKIADDILSLTNGGLEETLIVVPLRGGLPIYEGVSYALYNLLGKPYEVDVLFIPASSIVKDRRELISKTVEGTLKKREREYGSFYKTIVIVDEAISGASSKMVLDSVKDGVKNLKKDGYWRRNYWKEINIYLFDVVAYKGSRYEPRLRRMRNIMIYPVSEEIPTTDKSFYPICYINVLGYVESKFGIMYPIVSPDVVFYHKPVWTEIRKYIEEGVRQYIKSKKELNEKLKVKENRSLAEVVHI